MGIYVCSDSQAGLIINLYALESSIEAALQTFNKSLTNVGLAASKENVTEVYDDNFVEELKRYVIEHLAEHETYPKRAVYNPTDWIEESETVVGERELQNLLDVIGRSHLISEARKYAEEQGWPEPDLPKSF